MKRRSLVCGGFSMVEITLALGVAAFCLIAVMGMLPAGLKTQQASVQQTTANEIMATILGDLRADVRLPNGQQSKSQEGVQGLGLHGHWGAVATPDTLFSRTKGSKLALPLRSLIRWPRPVLRSGQRLLTYSPRTLQHLLQRLSLPGRRK
jgi:hypothetical protein